MIIIMATIFIIITTAEMKSALHEIPEIPT